MQITGMVGGVGHGTPANLDQLKRNAVGIDTDVMDQARLRAQSDQNVARMQAEAAKYPAQLQQERFNQVFPWLQGQIGGLMGNLSQSVGGASGQGPHISAGPTINPQMMQQQINAMRARSGQQLATQQRMNASQASARGMGAQSPLVQAMNNSAAMGARAQQMGGERDIRLGAATTNAEQTLRSQQAREAQFASRQGEDIERRRTTLGMFPQLFSSLSGLV